MEAPRPRTWKLSKPAFSRHYEIGPANTSTTTYTVDLSTFTRNKPNYTLHAGPSLKSNPPPPIVACVHTPKTSRSFTLGLGDPSSPQIQWEDVTKAGSTSFEYSFPCVLNGRQELLTWKRTSREAVSGMKASKFSKKDYKLVDGQGGVVAVFTHEFGLASCGVLEIRGDWGEATDLKILMTVTVLYDITRKQQNKAAAAGGGGGGGGG